MNVKNFKKIVLDEKKYCERKLREAVTNTEDSLDFPEYTTDYPEYWIGRINQLDAIISVLR